MSLPDGQSLPARRRLVALLALACLFGLAGTYLLDHARVASDPGRFMPGQTSDLPAPLRDLGGAGASTRPILARISGGDAQARANASRRLAEALAGKDAIARVLNGDESPPRDALERLLPYRYLLSPDVSADTFSQSSLKTVFEQLRATFASPLGVPDRDRLAADPTGEIRALQSRWDAAAGPPTRHGVWASPDSSAALLSIEPANVGPSLDRQAAVLADIRRTFREQTRTDALRLQMTGPMIFAVHSRDVIKAEVRRVTLLAGGFMVCLLLIAFRSVSLLLLAGLPLATAVTVGATTVSAIFGSIHGIVLAFGCTIVGVVVDYPVHLFSHRRGTEPPATTMRRIWPTIRLGVITTIIGYSAMVLADLRGLIELAVFAISGLAVAALVTRFALPGLMPERAAIRPPLPASRWLGRGRPAPGRTLVALAGVLALAVLSWQHDELWQNDLNAISPVPGHMQRLDAELRAAMGLPELRYLALVEGESEQAVLERSEALARRLEPLRQSGALERVEHPAELLPSAATQRARQASLPRRAVLAGRVSEAAAATGFREQAFAPFVEAVARARRLPPLTPEDLRGLGLAEPIKRQLRTADDRSWGIVRFRGVSDPGALHAAMAEETPSWLTFVDLKRRTESVLDGAIQSALAHLAIGLVLIVVVLGSALRCARRGLTVAMPAVLAALCTAALLVAAGIQLNLFHLASLLLVVGLGLDYALFFDRADGIAGERMASRASVCLCGLSTIGVFGILATSPLTVLADIGTTVTAGALLAIIFGWMCSARCVEGGVLE